MIRARTLVLAIAVSTGLVAATAGCHKNPPPAAAPTPPAPRPLTEEEIFARKSVDQLNSEKPLDDVFFDLDKSDIRDDGKSVLQRDADWLKKWSSTQVTVEGHADSRGSSEYNLGLGSRRAASVKDYLASLGVPANRLTVVSKGKEQPVCSEESESCWQQNRRGHFVITGK